MTCLRGRSDCEAMCAMGYESNNSFYCLGVVDAEARESPAHSKRFCIQDGEEFDLIAEFADEELFIIQSVISNGMLNVLQRASFYREPDDDEGENEQNVLF